MLSAPFSAFGILFQLFAQIPNLSNFFSSFDTLPHSFILSYLLVKFLMLSQLVAHFLSFHSFSTLSYIIKLWHSLSYFVSFGTLSYFFNLWHSLSMLNHLLAHFIYFWHIFLHFLIVWPAFSSFSFFIFPNFYSTILSNCFLKPCAAVMKPV